MSALVRKHNLVLFLIVLLGYFLRTYDLGRYGLWFDESASVLGAKLLTFKNIKDYGFFLTNLSFVFPFLLRVWLFFSDKDYFLRLFSVIFGVGSIGLTYLLTKEIVGKTLGKQTALMCSFLLAISPFHIFYSREVTQYSIAFFFSLCSTYFLLKCIKHTGLINSILFILSSLMCVYIHAFFTVFLLAELIYILFLRNKKILKKCLVNFLIIFLFYIPLVIVGLFHFKNILASRMLIWVPASSLIKIAALLNVFNIGYNLGLSLYITAFVIFIILFFLGVFKARKNIESFELLVILVVLPILFGFVISKLIPAFVYRYFIFSLPAYLIFVSYGIISFNKNNFIRFVILFGILFTTFFSLKNLYGNIYPLPEDFFRPAIHKGQPFRDAAFYVQERYLEGDLIGHTCASTWIPFVYYHNKELTPEHYKTFNSLLSFGRFKDSYSSTIDYFADIYDKRERKDNNLIAMGRKYADLDISKIRVDFKRVWLVYSSWEDTEHCQLCGNIRSWMLDNFELMSKADFGDIEIYLFNVIMNK